MVQRVFVFGLALTALAAIGCSSSTAPSTDGATPTGPAAVNAARLTKADAEAGQWMSHGRTYGEQRFSPLDQITTATAGKLGIFQKMSSGAGQDEFLTENDGPNTGPTSWSHDGRFVLYERLDPKTGRDTWALPLVGDRKPFPVLKSEFDEDHGSLSPDGRWICYQSNESGRSRFTCSRSRFQAANGRSRPAVAECRDGDRTATSCTTSVRIGS